MQKIILASRSPRRKQLLEWAEVPFDVLVKETDESFPANLSIEEAAIHIARNKALAVKAAVFPVSHRETVAHRENGLPILAADTIVVLHNEIIGKPTDREDA